MANVRDFGAAGNGIIDDSASFEHALQEGDGILEIPPGTYLLTHSIVIDLSQGKRVAIRGVGGTVKILMRAAGAAFDFRGTHDKSADPLSFKPEIWQHERFPTISGLEIEGQHAEANGLRFSGVMQPTITEVLIRRVRHGIHITKRARNVLISHCHIYHNLGCGIYLEQVNLHQINIVGCHISYNRLGGVRIENSEIRNLQITGNDIEYNNNAAHKVPNVNAEPTAEILIDCRQGGTVREMTIASNTLQATRSENGCNIHFIGGANSQKEVGMCTISSNIIGRQEINVHLQNCWGVVLEGNYIYSGHKRNVVIENSRNIVIGSNCLGHNPDYKELELCTGILITQSQHVALTGLQIQDAQAGKNTVKEALPTIRQGLIELHDCNYINLTGVQIFEGSPTALYLNQCQNTLITGCSLLDTRAIHLTEHAIEWLGDAAHCMISNCSINRPVKIPASVKMVNNIGITE